MRSWPLVALPGATHKPLVPQPLFDHRLRALRRDRAARLGVETFLFDRAFADCLDRLGQIRQPFSKILLAGCPNPDWVTHFSGVTIVEPGDLMAEQVNAVCADLDAFPFKAASFDLCISIGLLDTANDLPLAVSRVHQALDDGGLFLGAIAGGQSLPRLRRAMLAADGDTGQASPHVHPRIEAPSLARLLSEAGFDSPVVDVDRVELVYKSLDDFVADLRAMGATNILNARSRRPILRDGLAAARSEFLQGEEKVSELLEILHFAAWKPQQKSHG